jgi:Domain of unknown function (DUF4340)
VKSRGLLVSLVFLVALGGLLYWSDRKSSSKNTEAASAATSAAKILTLNQPDIMKVEVKKKESDGVVLSKNGSGVWRITAPKEYGADLGVVSTLLSTLSALNAERVVEEKSGDLSPYGLASPAVQLAITETGNKSQQLLIGDNTPTGSAAYAALAGDPRVFTIPSYQKASLEKGLSDFRDKRFLTMDSAESADWRCPRSTHIWSSIVTTATGRLSNPS